MSKGKKLLIFGIIIVLIAGATAGISILRDRGVIPDPESSEESSVHFESSSTQILDYDAEDIESIKVKNTAAAYTLVSSTATEKDSSGNSVSVQKWTMTEHPDWELSTDAVKNLVGIATGLRQVAIVAEDKSTANLAGFGLASPVANVTITYSDGREVTLSVGDTTPDGIYRYAMLSTLNEIFTVYKSVDTYAEYTLTNLRNIVINAIHTDETLYYLFAQKKDERPIEIEYSKDERENIYDPSYLRFISPYTWDSAIVSGNIPENFTKYETPTISELIESEAADLAKYCLAEDNFEYHLKLTTRMEVQTDSSAAQTESSVKAEKTYEYHDVDYYFGTDAGDGLIYFRQGDSTDVYTVDSSVLKSYSFEPFDYLQHLLYLFPINDLDSFSFTAKRTPDAAYETHKGSVLRQDEADVASTEDSSAKRLEVYYFDEILTDEDLFKDIYQLLIGIRLDYEILDEKPAYDPNDKITIKYTSVGGKTVTVELYRLSDLYYVTPYGDTWMACNMQQIKTLWEKTDLALAEE